MRTILLILFTVFLTTLTVEAQVWKSYISVVDSGDSVGTPFILLEGHALYGIQTPALESGQDTLQFDVKGQQNNAEFTKLKYSGAYYTIVLDTLGDAHTLNFEALGSWQIFRPVFTDPFTATDTLYPQSRKLE